MRNHQLDVLRAVAILLVFCYHSEGALLVARFGWAGVDLFFVLSGFLVSGLLFREYQTKGRVRAGRFLLRRGFKIYPQFYLLIGVTLLATVIWSRPSWSAFVAEVFFYQNYRHGLWAHTWSLAVEEHFYLLLAAAIVLLARRGGTNPFRWLPAGLLAAGAAILGVRTAVWIAHPSVAPYLQVFPSHMRIDSFFGGVLVAYFQSFHPERLAAWCRRWSGWIQPVSLLMLAPLTFLTREDAFMVTAGYTLVSWGFVLLLLSVLYPPKPAVPGRAGKAMAALGRVSYAFYLWHAPILLSSDWLGAQLAARGFPLPLTLALVPTFAASFAAAWLTTRMVENPMLGLRDRLFPSNARPALPPAPAPATAPFRSPRGGEAAPQGTPETAG